MVSAFCLKGSNFIMFSFSRCISGALSFPTTLQAKVMAAPPQPLPPRAAGCGSTNGFDEQTRSPAELLEPETCRSRSRDPYPLPSFSGTCHCLPARGGRERLTGPAASHRPQPSPRGRGGGELERALSPLFVLTNISPRL